MPMHGGYPYSGVAYDGPVETPEPLPVYKTFGQSRYGSSWHILGITHQPNGNHNTMCGRRLDVVETFRVDVVFENRPEAMCQKCDEALTADAVPTETRAWVKPLWLGTAIVPEAA